MKRKTAFILLVLIVLTLLAAVWRARLKNANDNRQIDQTRATPSQGLGTIPQNATADTSPAEATGERRLAVVEGIKNALATPIQFFGKVIDQNDAGVSNATITYGTLDRFAESGSRYQGVSDANGDFSITGIRGAVLRVGARKKGYYAIADKSSAAFAYGVAVDSNTRPPPTKESPAIFILRKMGDTEPLIVTERSYSIPKNGVPVEVNLHTGKKGSGGTLKVEAWTNDEVSDERGHYNWRCRLTVSGGGLIERSSTFDFEAPHDGYRVSDEILMSQESPDWQSRARREYFLKTGDQYARITFEMFSGGDHFFRLESFLNPFGSRNLEYDPEKRINK